MKVVNKVIVSRLKKRLNDAKGKWVEELPHVLWTYRITPRRSTEETPFSMTYGAEAVIPLETSFPTSRTSSFNPKDNNEQLTRSLDLIEEKRENAMVQLAHYQQKLKQGYDANVKLRTLTPGELVLCKSCGRCKESSLGKIRTKLGGTLSCHLKSWYWSIFSRRSGRTCNTMSLECKQPKEVLLLISILMINLFVLHIKCLYCSLFTVLLSV